MYQNIAQGRARAHRIIKGAGYAVGGTTAEKADRKSDEAMIRRAISEHETQEHGGKHSRITFKAGGLADGGMASSRLDRSSRGHKSPKNQINIAVVPHPPGQPGMGTSPMMPPRPPVAPPVAAAPPVPPRPMPPPGMGAPPPGMPPGGMGMPGGVQPRPMGIKTGGRARRQMGGQGMGPLGMPPGSPPPTQQQAQQAMQAGQAAQMQAARMGQPWSGGGSNTGALTGPPTGGGPNTGALAKKGGRAHHADGGSLGRAGVGEPRFNAGAGSARGRLEKKSREGAERWGDGE